MSFPEPKIQKLGLDPEELEEGGNVSGYVRPIRPRFYVCFRC